MRIRSGLFRPQRSAMTLKSSPPNTTLPVTLSERRAARLLAPRRAPTCRATIWSRVSGVAAESETASRTAQGMSSPIIWGRPPRAPRGEGVRERADILRHRRPARARWCPHPRTMVSPTRGRTSYATGQPVQGCKLAPDRKGTCMDGLMIDLPLTLLHAFDGAGRYFGKTRMVSAPSRQDGSAEQLRGVPPARAEARQRALSAWASSRATAWPRWPGTIATTWRLTSAFPSWRRAAHAQPAAVISRTRGSKTTPGTPSSWWTTCFGRSTERDPPPR